MENISTTINWILAALNAAFLIYAAWQKLKPEVKKMEAEGDLDVLEGAEKSQQLLVDRINELKQQRTEDNERWKELLGEESRKWKAELDAEKEARKKDVEYLRRKFREADREARDYRRWAATLVKQVVEAGKVPAAFIPSTEDSETGITSPFRTDQEGQK